MKSCSCKGSSGREWMTQLAQPNKRMFYPRRARALDLSFRLARRCA